MDINYDEIYKKYLSFYDNKWGYDKRNNYVELIEEDKLQGEYNEKVEDERAWELDVHSEEKSQYQLKLEYDKFYEDKCNEKHCCESKKEYEDKCNEKHCCESKKEHEDKCNEKHCCESKKEYEDKCNEKHCCEGKEEHEDKCDKKYHCESKEHEDKCDEKHHCECKDDYECEKGEKGNKGERGKKGKDGERGKRGHKGKRGKPGPNVGKSNASICCANPSVVKSGMSIIFNESLINGKYIEFKDGSDYISLRAGGTYFVRYTFTAYPMNSCNSISATLQLNGVDVCGGAASSTGTKCSRSSQSVSAGSIITTDEKSECNKLTLVSQKNAQIVGGNFTSIQIIRLY